MRHLDLFSGIGGFALAAYWTWGDEHEVVCFVEQDEFCQKVLKRHWPDVPIVGDVRNVGEIMAHTESSGRSTRSGKGEFRGCGEVLADTSCGQSRKQTEREGREDIGGRGQEVSSRNVEVPQLQRLAEPGMFGADISLRSSETRASDQRKENESNGGCPDTGTSTNVDLLTGGFPCQSFSVAGKRRGKEDDRYLWPEMLEVIKAVKPTYIIAENVVGIVNMALDTVLSDLEDQGYSCQGFIIPACAQNAPHRRDRVWIVAYTTIQHDDRCGYGTSQVCRKQSKQTEISRSRDRQPQSRLGIPNDGFSRWLVRAWGTGEWEEGIPRVATGVKDRVNKLKALGNAICIPTVMPIMQAIKALEEV